MTLMKPLLHISWTRTTLRVAFAFFLAARSFDLFPGNRSISSSTHVLSDLADP